jgi:uncharacterized membrane protein
VTSSQPQGATIGTLHSMLAMGIVILALVFAALGVGGYVPLTGHDAGRDVVAAIFAGLQLVMLAVALFVLRPRIPQRSAAQSVQTYWSAPETISRVLPVWFLCDGAAILGIVCYGLTASLLPAAVAGAAFLTFLMLAPARIAGG